MNEETWEETDEAFRNLTVGEAVREEAEENPIIAEWMLALLDRRVISASDRRLFGLKPLALPGLALVKSDEANTPEDDLAEPIFYNDAVFRLHGGLCRALPWANLRTWIMDANGSRLSFIWPETTVSLAGRRFTALEEPIQRRSIGEFRQVAPGEGDNVRAHLPVIETIKFE